EDGPIGSFQFAHGAIAIYGHEERIAERARLHQVTRVPDVQQIKHTICKHQPRAFIPKTRALREHIFDAPNFVFHPWIESSIIIALLWRREACPFHSSKTTIKPARGASTSRRCASLSAMFTRTSLSAPTW